MMKESAYHYVATLALLAILAVGAGQVGAADSLWGKIKETASGAVDTVTETVQDATSDETPEQSRAKIDAMEKQTLKRLFSENKIAEELFGKSYGYAVFDTRKFSFLITTGFGAGVAVEKGSAKRTYMKMATGGVNVGLGGKLFQVVFLFEKQANFRKFVDEGFDVGSQASAVAGKDAEQLGAQFIDGLAVYQLTDKGLMLAADLTGTRYWKNDELN